MIVDHTSDRRHLYWNHYSGGKMQHPKHFNPKLTVICSVEDRSEYTAYKPHAFDSAVQLNNNEKLIVN